MKRCFGLILITIAVSSVLSLNGNIQASSKSSQPLPAQSGTLSQSLSKESYLRLFLEASDLPAGMERVQDSRTQGADPKDAAYKSHHGEASGMAAWMGADNAPIWRVVDIRWVFPTEAEAAAYIKETWRKHGEGQPEVRDAKSVGENCHVFGGTKRDEVLNMNLTQFYYVFRTGRVVVKLYVAQGPLEEKPKLTAEMVRALAEKISMRTTSPGRILL